MSETSGAWEESLKFEEVAKFFSLPIAEAASILGVCSSVLKKICRDNGVLRWPYRKVHQEDLEVQELCKNFSRILLAPQEHIKNIFTLFKTAGTQAETATYQYLAGKTVEEIKKDAARERSKELAELSKAARLRMDGSATISSTSAVPSSLAMQTHPRLNLLYQHTQLQNRTLNSIHGTAKLQPGDSLQGHISQQPENKLLQNGRHHMHHSGHMRGIPNYMDEFKHGFPTDGLSSASVRWWGSSNGSSNTDMTAEEESAPKEEAEHSIRLSNDAVNHRTPNADSEHTLPESDTVETFDTGSEAAVSLLRMRKRNADDGRAVLKLGVTRGYGACRLGRRERMLLLWVFNESSLPGHWRCSFS